MPVKHETIEVSGLVMYCDGCGVRGPETAYDNHPDLEDQAEQMGWTRKDEGSTERFFCDACSKPKGKGKKR